MKPFAVAFLVAVFCSSMAVAQVPRFISYQGSLTDSLGTPKPDGDYVFTFRLYADSAGGTPVWTDQRTVRVKRGLFSAQLGGQPGFESLFSAQRWLSLQIVPDPEIARRIPLLATAYTFRAIKADTAQYALTAPQQGFADSARIAGTVRGNSVDSTKLTANSVTNTKLAPGFKAPNAVKADTAQYALTAPQQGFADSARIAGTVPNAAITNPKLGPDAVTNDKIFDNTILRVDVAANFKAPYADTADYVKNVPTADSARIAGTVPNAAITNPKLGPDAVTTDKILTNTILRADVAANFKAPYADTADYVKNVPIADSARIAGTIPGNSIDSTKLASNSVTNTKLATGFKAPDAVIADSARNAWSLTGNAGTDPSTNFIGTTDNRDFIIKQNGQERIRVDSGGHVLINPGVGGDGEIRAGNAQGSGNGGTVLLTGGNATTGIGGPTGMFGGTSQMQGGGAKIGGGTATGTGGLGGDVICSGGRAEGSGGVGGTLFLFGGDTQTNGNGGNVDIRSRNGTGAVGNGGSIFALAGDGATAGGLSFTAGTGQVKGGDITMKSGVAGGAFANAGNFEFTAGNSIVGRPGGFRFQIGASTTIPPQNGRFEIVGAAAQRRLTIDSIGNVGIGVTSPTNILTVQQNSTTDPIADAWTIYSSRRWKTNIHTLDNALETVERLRGVSYDWKANGKHDIGLIAEEVGNVIPEVVQYEENGVDARSVDYPRLVAVLIEAVKDQQKQIEQLQAAVKSLQTNTHIKSSLAN